jgi:Tol biopolymer transport system component
MRAHSALIVAIVVAGCSGEKATGPKTVVQTPQTTVSFLRSSTYNGQRRLMIAEIGAADPTPITPASENVSPGYSWSPDGQRVAYGTESRGVRIINRDGSGEHLLAGSDTIPSPTWIAWSPDGRSIATSEGGVLWIIPASGGAPIAVLTSLTGGAYSPAWSPDSRLIAITSPTSNHLGLLTASTGAVQMFSVTAAHPDWSPDGSVLFLADRAGLAKPFVMNADTSQITPVTSGGFYDDVPRWVP